MADTKISALTDGTALAATDRIPVARSPFGAGDNRYITGAELGSLSQTPWASDIDAAGFNLSFDNSTGIVGELGGKIVTFQDYIGDETYLVWLDISNAALGFPYNGIQLVARVNGDIPSPTSNFGQLGTGVGFSFWGLNPDNQYDKILQLQPTALADIAANVGHSYLFIEGGIHHAPLYIGGRNDYGTHTPISWEMEGGDTFRMRWRTGTPTYTGPLFSVSNTLDGGCFMQLQHERTSPAYFDFPAGINLANSQASLFKLDTCLLDATGGSEDGAALLEGTVNGTLKLLGYMGAGWIFGDMGTFNNTNITNAIAADPGIGNVKVTGQLAATTVKTTATIVGSLPAAATAGAGARSFVTDATVTTFASVVAGTGGNAVPVYSDGSNWRIG